MIGSIIDDNDIYNFFSICVNLKKNNFVDISILSKKELNKLVADLYVELKIVLEKVNIINILDENIDMITYSRRKLYNRIIQKTFMLDEYYTIDEKDINRMCNAFSKDILVLISENELEGIKKDLYNLLKEFNNKTYSKLFYTIFSTLLEVLILLYNNINCLNINYVINKKFFLECFENFITNKFEINLNRIDIQEFNKIQMQLIYHNKHTNEIILHPIYNDQHVDIRSSDLFKYDEDYCRKLIEKNKIEIVTTNKVYALLVMPHTKYYEIKKLQNRNKEYNEIYDVCYQSLNESLILPSCKTNKVKYNTKNLSSHIKELLNKDNVEDYVILYTENRGWSNYKYDDTTYKNLPGGRRNYIFDKNLDFRCEDLEECLTRELKEELHLKSIDFNILEVTQVKSNIKYCIVEMIDIKS